MCERDGVLYKLGFWNAVGSTGFRVGYVRKVYWLGNFEGEREVVSALVGRELRIVEGVGQEVVQQRAEGQPVRPARGEVLQLHILREQGPLADAQGCCCWGL